MSEQAIQERVDAATPGPWSEDRLWVAVLEHPKDDYAELPADVAFVSHAREDVPWLLSELAAAEARAVRAEAALKAAEKRAFDAEWATRYAHLAGQEGEPNG